MSFLFDCIFLLPEIFFILSFINLIFFFSVLKPSKFVTCNDTVYLNYIIKFLILMLFFTICLYSSTWTFMTENAIFLFFMTLKKSYLTQIFQMLILICGLLYLIYLKNYITLSQITDLRFEYFYILQLNIWGFLILILTNDLLFLFFLFEFTSFGLYILISYNIVNNKAIEAALKYFVFGAIISSIFLFAIYLLYFSLGVSNLNDIQLLLSFVKFETFSVWSLNILVGVLLLFCVLIFKLGIFPFHFWPPVIYEGISYKTLLYIFSIPKLSYIYLIINFYYNIFLDLVFYTATFFTIIAILSILVGTISGLVQTKIKKLLSFSGIVNFSYILLILSTTSGYDLEYIILYLIIYLSNIFFLFYLFLYFQKYKIVNPTTFVYISELKALKSKNFLFCVCVSLILFSLSGFPPFGGFFVKYLLLLNLALTKAYFLLVVFLIINIISCFYYIRLIRLLFFNRISDTNLLVTYNTTNNAQIMFKNLKLTSGFTSCIILWFIFNIYFSVEPTIIYYFITSLVF